MAINANTLKDAIRPAITAVCFAYREITQERIDAACAVLTGEMEAVDAAKPAPLEPPMSCDDAAKMLGISKTALHYHARCGRIRRANIPGSKRARGFVAADVRAILEGRAA